MPRFVDSFKALFLDMNGTFMFDHDRLERDEDFFSTYRRLGGYRLMRDEVQEIVAHICVCLRRDYEDASRFEKFPTLADAVRVYGRLDLHDTRDIVKVIAAHEVGKVPAWAAETLRILSATHPLVVVSNVWAPAETWDLEFERSGIAHVFQHRVFSSSIGAVKPSRLVFRMALDLVGVEAKSVLFIGDSIERDVLPAKQIGCGTVLVGECEGLPLADLTVRSIAELLGEEERESIPRV